MTKNDDIVKSILGLDPKSLERIACLVEIVRQGKSASGKWLTYKGELKLKKEVDING